MMEISDLLLNPKTIEIEYTWSNQSGVFYARETTGNCFRARYCSPNKFPHLESCSEGGELCVVVFCKRIDFLCCVSRIFLNQTLVDHFDANRIERGKGKVLKAVDQAMGKILSQQAEKNDRQKQPTTRVQVIAGPRVG